MSFLPQNALIAFMRFPFFDWHALLESAAARHSRPSKATNVVKRNFMMAQGQVVYLRPEMLDELLRFQGASSR